MRNNAYILAAGRTWTGRYFGAYRHIPITDLASTFIKRFLEQHGFSGANGLRIEGCYFGIVNKANTAQHPVRQAALHAGLGPDIDTIDFGKICASSFISLKYGTSEILLWGRDLVIAGGAESMTRMPYYIEKNAHVPLDIKSKTRDDSFFSFSLEEYMAHDPEFTMHSRIIDGMNFDGLCDAYDKSHALMGHIAEAYIKEAGISRGEMDDYAYTSFLRAKENQALISRQIIPIDGVALDFDEGWRKPDRIKMESLKPVFADDGLITSANASQVSDGVSGVVLCSEKAAQYFAKIGTFPLARIITFAVHSQEPNAFLTAPIGAIQKVCESAHIRISDVDLFEINEAFAIVPIAAMKELGIPRAQVNIWGGAIANGHPLGASGTKILSNLVYQLKDTGARYGIAAACNGGGEAVAVLIENYTE